MCMTHSRKSSFANHSSWTSYRDILREEFAISFPIEPTEHWQEIRGHSIRYDLWEHDWPSVGTVILVHGGGGSGRILAPAALPALQAGWRVIAPDLPGYGLSIPAQGFNGDYSEWPKIITEIADGNTGPVVLLGMSLGGLTAVFAAQLARSVDGVIATTLVDPSDPTTFDHVARWPWLGRLCRFAMRWMPGLLDRISMPLALATPLRAMTGSKRLQEYFVRDPLLGGNWMTSRFFRLIHQRQLESVGLNCPLLLIHPGSDEWTPTEMSMPVFERLKTDKTLIELSNGTHLPLERPAFDEFNQGVGEFLARRAANALETKAA